jgi:hypothetical protein
MFCLVINEFRENLNVYNILFSFGVEEYHFSELLERDFLAKFVDICCTRKTKSCHMLN